jgi:hypothetical protein
VLLIIFVSLLPVIIHALRAKLGTVHSSHLHNSRTGVLRKASEGQKQ